MTSRSAAATKGGKPVKVYSATEADPIIKSFKVRPGNSVLAKITHTQHIDLDSAGWKTPKTLITEVKVIQRTPQHSCATNFSVKFSLDDKVDTMWEVGTLHAQTIDMQTRGISEPSYMTELLRWDLERPLCHTSDSETNVDETQTIMRHIFHQNGTPRNEYHNRPLRCAKMHFISAFEMIDEFHGPGLAQLAMKGYHEAAQRLPEKYAFKGTIVLSPAALRSVFVAKAGGQKPAKSYVEIEHALISSYRKSGYKVWTKGDDGLEGSAITVMGRTIGDVSSHEEDRAAETMFPPFVKVDGHAPAKGDQDMKAIEKLESATARNLGLGGDIYRVFGVMHQAPSRKRKALEEALDDGHSRPVKRRPFSPSDFERSR